MRSQAGGGREEAENETEIHKPERLEWLLEAEMLSSH